MTLKLGGSYLLKWDPPIPRSRATINCKGLTLPSGNYKCAVKAYYGKIELMVLTFGLGDELVLNLPLFEKNSKLISLIF